MSSKGQKQNLRQRANQIGMVRNYMEVGTESRLKGSLDSCGMTARRISCQPYSRDETETITFFSWPQLPHNQLLESTGTHVSSGQQYHCMPLPSARGTISRRILNLTSLLPHTNLVIFYCKSALFRKGQVIKNSNKMSTWSITSLPVPWRVGWRCPMSVDEMWLVVLFFILLLKWQQWLYKIVPIIRLECA